MGIDITERRMGTGGPMRHKYEEHIMVRLKDAWPERGLPARQPGTVVMCLPQISPFEMPAYLVELSDRDVRNFGVPTLYEDQLIPWDESG